MNPAAASDHAQSVASAVRYTIRKPSEPQTSRSSRGIVKIRVPVAFPFDTRFAVGYISNNESEP